MEDACMRHMVGKNNQGLMPEEEAQRCAYR
jgi:hypothetical protein